MSLPPILGLKIQGLLFINRSLMHEQAKSADRARKMNNGRIFKFLRNKYRVSCVFL